MADALMTKEAVASAMAEHAAVKALLAWNADAVTAAKFDRGELTLTIAAEQIVAATEALRAAGYNYFEDMTAVDWFPASPRFQLSYHFVSHGLKERVRLAAFVDGDQPSIASITPAWPSANYFEREVFDLMGICFEGHPNLRRILMPDEWQGHPLRKDYPVEGYR